jgi:hypothetical protein
MLVRTSNSIVAPEKRPDPKLPNEFCRSTRESPFGICLLPTFVRALDCAVPADDGFGRNDEKQAEQQLRAILPIVDLV